MHKIVILLTCFVLVACQKELSSIKEPDKKQCWFLINDQGFDQAEVCDKTRAEMDSAYIGLFFFYPATDPRFCWKIQQPASKDIFLRNKAQYAIEIAFPAALSYTVTKINCDSFCNWVYQDKRKNKHTGVFRFGIETIETFLPDSCSKISVGQEVVIRETEDSVYTRKFIRKED